MGKMTKKALAINLGINEKTLRNKKRLSDNLSYIIECVGQEKGEKFNEIYINLQNNKKESISFNQIAKMVTLPKNEIERIVDIIIEHPDRAKAIINNNTWDCEVKTTVTLPSYINDWLIDKSEELGLSKSGYIEYVITNLHLADLKEN